MSPLTVQTRPLVPRTVAPTEPAGSEELIHAPVPLSRVVRVGVLAGLLLTGILGAALVVGGGGPPPTLPGLPDPGAVTGWGRPLVDLVVRVLAVLAVGQLTYAALLAPTGPAGGTVSALRGTTWCATGWLVAEGSALVLTASSVYSVPVTGLSLRAVRAVLMQLPAGRAALWVALLLAAVIVGTAWLARLVAAGDHRGRTRAGSALLLLAALGAVVLPAVLAGHSAAADDHVPAVVALSVHIVTASLWVGGLVALLMHGRDRSRSVHAVRRFSTLALACVVLLLASGVISAVLVAGRPTLAWATQGWVLLLSIKSLLLGCLTLIGWWHRRRTLPALATGAPRAFLRLSVVEVALMSLTITLSVALSASPAPSPTMATTTTVDVNPQLAEPAGAGSSTPAPQEPAEDMSGHDHGELSVSILVDTDRFHVAGTVRPGQPVTVYNRSSAAATISALDGTFDADVGPRTFITFIAPAAPGDYDFTNRGDSSATTSFADTLQVRADP